MTSVEKKSCFSVGIVIFFMKDYKDKYIVLRK